MKVLVVGGGGREHALCWKLARSPLLSKLYCAPGNPGIAELAEIVPIGASRVDELTAFAAEKAVDLTVVGPEQPLTEGLADLFAEQGLPVFGASRAAARLEGSKVFAKEFMRRQGIPSADFVVTTERDETRRAAERFGFPVVLKADGLAAGKGVLIINDGAELEEALAIFFDERRFGSSGDRIVVEECLTGEEVSIIALSDGERLLDFATSKDYKRIGENDSGPNTGGMGAHSPAGVLGAEEERGILESVMRRTIEGMAAEGSPFVGVLYGGLMLTPDGPRVLEFNVRFGDPEAQPLMLRLDEDLLPVLAAGAAGRFEAEELRFAEGASACIVLASAGYPGTPAKGEEILGIEAARAHAGVEVFHAGTASEAGRIVASGGRVLNVCALGSDLSDALGKAYAAAAEITWPSKVLRRDIGRRVVEESR